MQENMPAFRDTGIDNIMRVELLPFLKTGVRVHYEGSIDKAGGNADWDWWLYQDRKGEWVLIDVDGPGCIYNFVQHRYPTSEEPVFRFYFDGEKEPRFEIRHSQFGEKYPFVEPLASRYIGPCENGRGPIRVVRSFVPMPFRQSCRITSSVQLKGFDKDEGDGGWGHVLYHEYEAAGDMATFSADDNYDGLIQQWKNIGTDPKNLTGHLAASHDQLSLAPGELFTFWQDAGPGAIAAVLMRLEGPNPALQQLWIRMTWDGHERPDIDLPVPCFFANELMVHKTTYLMAGYQPEGICYNYFPMPYWSSACIELINQGSAEIRIPWVGIRTADCTAYPREDCAYFRAAYYPRKATIGSDSILADIRGRGHVVSALITAQGSHLNEVTCEGDVRVYIDGNLTPQVESDGSESYGCYGWGFPTPPETNPASGYDGLQNSPWSMNRHCLGDWYPFERSLRFGIESGGCNDQYLQHSGAVFYYGVDQEAARQTDELDIGSPESERLHRYRASGGFRLGTLTAAYEGDDDHIMITDAGVYGELESSFTVAVDPCNIGVMLRRRSDQERGRQKACVWVDDVRVEERCWYHADRNTIKRWLDDEFMIPAKYTAGKSHLSLRIVPEAVGGQASWNEFRYWAYSMVNN